MVWSLDEPSADFAALQTHMLAVEARRNGIKVLLSGVGGDDLFTGYGRHGAAYAYAALSRYSGLRTLVALALRRIRPTSVRRRRLQRLGLLLGLDEETMLVEAMSFSPIMGAQRMQLLAPDLRRRLPADGVPDALAASLANTVGLHAVERLLDMEVNGFLPDLNLNYTDKMAMLAGVEVRVPLVDTRLVDFAAGLPLDARIGRFKTKRILRASQADRLPASVLTRPKQGFGVPIRAWLRGPARPLLEELAGERAVALRGLFSPAAVVKLRTDFLEGRNDAALTLFPLMAIELWCRALDNHPTV
jgi:asparagine synthase (glutamine-hydrolysing)